MVESNDEIEKKRLVMLLIKQDLPDFNEIDYTRISKPQRTGYLSRVTTFLKLVHLFGYKREINGK